MHIHNYINALPKQLVMVLTEEVVHDLYDNLPEQDANDFLIKIIRFGFLGEEPGKSRGCEANDTLLFKLLCDKARVFGVSMYKGEGEEDG